MKDLVLLPGALGVSAEFSELGSLLKTDYHLHFYDFPGHGTRAGEQTEFSIEVFAHDLGQWLKAKNLKNVNLFGYSMGGYVALYLASIAPELVGRIATLGTKLHWTKEFAAGELRKLQPESLAVKVPEFANMLARVHGEANWPLVVKGTAELMGRLGDQPLVTSELLSSLEIPVLLGLGDKDRMVTLQETQHAFQSLQHGQLSVLPNTPHVLDKVPATLLAAIIREFFQIK